MKPNFALNFTDDSVALLHREKRGWLEIGRCAYDRPDLTEAMAYLRATALGLSPQDLTTKLVIPASQIRYFRIDAPGPSESDRHNQIAAALEGRTAYTVDELAFDWSGGPVVDVAVVARETLAEAEAFAIQHHFTPLSFVTLPENGSFNGEPWFGPTEHASNIIAAKETIDRDSDTIIIPSRSSTRSDAPTDTPAADIGAPQETRPKTPAHLLPELAPVPKAAPEIPPHTKGKPPETTITPDQTKDLPPAAKMGAFHSTEAPIALDVAEDETLVTAKPQYTVTPRSANTMLAKDSQAVKDDDHTPAPSFTNREVPTLAGATAAAAQSMARHLGAASRDTASVAKPQRIPEFSFAETAKPPRPATTTLRAQPPVTALVATDPRKNTRNLIILSRSKPLGLVLAGLLFAIFTTAILSYYTTRVGTEAPTALASANGNTTTPQEVPADTITNPSINDEMLADGQDIATDPALKNISSADVAPETTSRIPTANKGNDAVYLSEADAVPSASDTDTIPLLETNGDSALSTPPPPAFGTLYQFNANSLIVPTPEGIKTPQNVFLVAGKPPLIPPARPADLANGTNSLTTDEQTQTFPADPALRGKRPVARPTKAAKPHANNKLFSTGSRFASLRPPARPVTISALTIVTPKDTASSLGGLVLSPRPVARSSTIASASKAADTARVIEPKTKQEPQLANVSPSIPTKANVAKEATDKNEIDLNKINLIGVFGTQSNRYALIRQANGRIIKVSVGDRIDGGRVAAVTATEVRYEKHGQILVLAMPRG